MNSSPFEISSAARLLRDEPLAHVTSFRIGGPAEYLLLPACTEDVISAIDWAIEHDIPWRVIGSGTNILVVDEGLPGVTIKFWQTFNKITIKENRLTAQAGADMLAVAMAAAESGLAGFEWASGIPGTIGGAIYMNAGVKDLEIKNHLLSATVINDQGQLVQMTNADLQFNYRTSLLQKQKGTVIEAVFEFESGEKNEIFAEMNNHLNERRLRQPINRPNCGSVFRNPPGTFAGKLVEELGLKGHKIGGAQISQQHANFIVNTGEATAKDVLQLIDLVQTKVRERYELEMELEMLIIK
jgi:UDP-N-acetylmuramate dehydrogenase